MDIGSLPSEILRLILPSHGKAVCIAAQVCSSWRAFLRSQLRSHHGSPQLLPHWCQRWQIADLAEANFALATLCRMQPKLSRFATLYRSDGELLTEADMTPDAISNHLQLGLPLDTASFRFFTARSFSGDACCWNNVALMEFTFGDDLDRLESWWLLVEARLASKPHGDAILKSLFFGSSWLNLYRNASLLSPEVITTPHFAHNTTIFSQYSLTFSRRLASCICFTTVRSTDRSKQP